MLDRAGDGNRHGRKTGNSDAEDGNRHGRKTWNGGAEAGNKRGNEVRSKARRGIRKAWAKEEGEPGYGESLWCLLGGYFWQYRRTVLVFLLFSLIYLGIFPLYDLETEAVLYAAALCMLSGLAIVGVRFCGYVKEHRERMRGLKNIGIEYDSLSGGRNPVEQDYQRMLRALGRIHEAYITDMETKRQETLDYYTAWVHQIKTPIAVMRIQLQGEDIPEHQALLAELFRIEQYVEMVLCYMRLNSDSSDLVIKLYDLDGIIRRAVHKYAPQFVQKRLRLVYEPVQMTVLTDEKWLQFVIEQLLSNAIKYTGRGTVTISVTQDKVLRVADTGMGIAPEDLPRIFERGFTGYNGRTDRKSTGLGLYLCKRAADRLSAAISVQSVPGEGSVFSVDLHTDPLEVE